jgi:C-terminal processing protease CtpA/Prc
MKSYQVTVQKESQATQFGLMLSQKAGSSQILIKNIAPNGVFGGTELVPGLQVMEINRRGFSGKTVQDAVQVLKEAPVGQICVVARGEVATVRKKTKDTKVGISIQKKISDNGGPAEMIVKNISQDGLFANSGLQAGQRITVINGHDCPEKSSKAIEMIREAVGELTIVAVESISFSPPPEQAPSTTPTLSQFLEDHHKSSPRDSGVLSTTVLDGCKPDEKKESSRTPLLGSFLENHRASSHGSEFDSVSPLPDKPETEEEEYTIELNSPEVSKRMLNAPVLAEGVVIDSEYGSNAPTSAKKPYEVTAIISKSYPGEKVGLALRNSKKNKRVIVNKIIKGGLADKSKVPLRIGQTVLSINGQDCPLSAKRATDLITEAPRTVTVVATNTVATAYKASANTKIGISLKSSNKNDDVLVESVSPNGLFANSNLREGQIVAAINGQECPATAHSAIQILKSCVGKLTIVVGDRAIQPKLQAELKRTVQESRSPYVPKAAATVAQQNGGGRRSVITNKEKGKWIGVSFGMSQGSIIVRKIADESPLAGFELKVGQKIVSVNGGECPKTMPDLISLIYRTSGTLTLVSAEISQDEPIFAPVKEPQKPTSSVLPPGQVWAHITHKEKDQHVGLKVIRSFQGRIVISTIRKDGLLGNSDLCIGQYIVSINGTPCPSTKGETTKLIKDAVGPVAIVASLSIGTAEKSKASTPVGISLGKQKDDIVIMKLSENGLLHGGEQSNLREGQRVSSINGQPCPTTVHDAISIIKECVGRLTIEAVDRFKVKPTDDATAVRAAKESAPLPTDGPSEEDSPGEFKEILATVTNKKSSDMLALSIGVTQNYAFVNHIAADSPFIETDLCVGHRIAKIDGEPCPLPLQDALELFAQHVGTITIDALEKVVSIGQVSASMVKKSKQTPAAVQVATSAQGRLVISEIDENGPFACSVLQVGQVLESVNGTPCHDNDSMKRHFGAATGKVTIVASPTVATAFKENIDQKAGIILRRVGEASEVLVQEIKKDGLFGKSDLRQGQKIVSIAGVQCPKDLREAVGLIQDCVGELKIVAVDTLPRKEGEEQHAVPVEAGTERTETYVRQVTVSSTKKTKQSRIGMKLRKGMQRGKVVISKINEDGPMAGKGLKVGMWIVSINNEPCPRDPRWATERIKGLVGNVIIVASPTVATVNKKAKKTKVGLSLAKTQSSTVFIHHIVQGGLFENTDLQVGQNIIAIDGKKCEWSLQGAIKSIADCVGELEIVALDSTIMKKS